MRQRLGLARVLLGKPEILVLDEPTNGLDPGEMREVRQLVRRVAEAGSTVLFSSHVLAEVEQICTHAVVMDKGKLVATGSVSDLIGTSGTVYLEVDDSAAARRVLEALPSVQRVDDEMPGLAVTMDGGRRSDLVAALVGRRASRSRPSPRAVGSRTRSSDWSRACDAHPRRAAHRAGEEPAAHPHLRRVRDPRADPDHHGGGDQPQPARRARRGPAALPRVADRPAAPRLRAAASPARSCS